LYAALKKKYASYLSELLFIRLFKISILGSINSCLLANDLFSVKTKQGNNIKLDSIPKANVMINPRATVPPKSESINTEKPENKTTEV
jgi:hypothetical protein